MAEVEQAREEARRKYQGELDRTKAELTRLQSTPAPVAPASGDGKPEGFDPEAFRRTLLSEVYGATALSQTASSLKAEFPHADPALFTPERISTFATPDALRFAVEDSHRRVAAILDAERAAIEAKVREELAAGASGSQGPSGGTPAPAGEPTFEQISAMSITELNTLEKERPGLVERVLRGVAA